MPHSASHRSRVTLALMAAVAALTLAVGVSTAAAAPMAVHGGTSYLTTDEAQTFVDLWGANAVFMPVPPSTIYVNGASFTIPMGITSGTIDPVTRHGTLHQTGGFIVLSKQTMSAWTTLEFTKITIKLAASSTVSGSYLGTVKTFATLDLSGATVSKSHSGGHTYVNIKHVTARMTDWFFNEIGSFIPSYSGPSHVLGTFRIKARVS
jgi:hypothetical protein